MVLIKRDWKTQDSDTSPVPITLHYTALCCKDITTKTEYLGGNGSGVAPGASPLSPENSTHKNKN